MRRAQHGFTLIELMFVVAMIGILAAVAIPAYQDYVLKSRLAETLTLAEPIKKAISDYYDRWGAFPENNRQAALSAPESFMGNYVQAITIAQGVIHISMRKSKKLANASGKALSLRPAFNPTYPTGPIAWVCEGGPVPEGLQVVGEITNANSVIDEKVLPPRMQKCEMNIFAQRFLQRPFSQHILLDVMISVFIIALLVLLAVGEMKLAIVKTKGVEVFSDFEMERIALSESFALSGVWPDRQLLHIEQYKKPVLAIVVAKGAVNLKTHDKDHPAASKVLSMRPALGVSHATLLWVCGNAAIPDGMQVSGSNMTTLNRDELYVVCR